MATILAAVLIVAVAFGLFRGDFTESVPVTVISDRAGLVMNPDAKVELHGVKVGTVASIESRSDTAVLHLAIDPAQLHLIPVDVSVDIASTTVFGAKYVHLIAPPRPVKKTMRRGQVIRSEHVTVEVNTVFEQLSSLLSVVQPEKLNQLLTGIASALSGRGTQIGEIIGDLDATLVRLDPSLPSLSHDLQVAPAVFNTYADASSDLLRTAHNASALSQTIVAEQRQLDAMLMSVIGFGDIGNDVLATNREAIADVLHSLSPVTGLTNQYHTAVNCSLVGAISLAKTPPLRVPGAEVSASLEWGANPYRYPTDLPKVAATGGPHCVGLPQVPFETRPPYVVADVGTNPWKFDNHGIVLNFAGLKELLFGHPVDGPPRNSAQIGMPG